MKRNIMKRKKKKIKRSDGAETEKKMKKPINQKWNKKIIK
jgi:hypothetical protein